MTKLDNSVQLCADRVAPEKAVHLEPPFCTTISRNATRGVKMKHIPLTQGKFAIVDDEDFDIVNKYNWHISHPRKNGYYARAYIGDGKYVYMHRIVMKAKTGQYLDHINRNGLDNRKCNLRFATYSQNAQNRFKRVGVTSKYKGVSFYKNCKRWRAEIHLNYKKYQIGYFGNEIEAAKAYDIKAKELFGEFARTNFL